MRVFDKLLHLGRKAIKFHIAVYDEGDTYAGMASGLPWKEPQFLFLDYDENYEPKEWEWIVNNYDLKRAIIIESSRKKYWSLSFTPLWFGIICEIMMHSKADKRRCQHLFRDGFVGIRLSKKKVSYARYPNPKECFRVDEYPRVIKEIINRKETFSKDLNVYDFDREKFFIEIIEKGTDFLDMKDVFKGLIKQKEVDEQ
jgi:hypothetical protein